MTLYVLLTHYYYLCGRSILALACFILYGGLVLVLGPLPWARRILKEKEKNRKRIAVMKNNFHFLSIFIPTGHLIGLPAGGLKV